MSYLRSNDVNVVFPSTYRNIGNGKFTSEFNFVNIINSLVDSAEIGHDGYVLYYGNPNNTLKVIIHGYYFEIENFSISGNKWLEIKVAEDAEYLANHYNNSTELDEGAEGSKEFRGLSVTDTEPSHPETPGYVYHVLQVSKDGNIINKARLVTDSVDYKNTGKNQQSLTKELDAKQYNLVAGNGIDTISNNQAGNNIIKLKDDEMAKLNSLETTDHSGRRLVYFDAEGKANDSTQGAGLVWDGNKEQTVYISNGTIQNGFTVYAAKNTNPTGGKPGDIWFKYQ